MTCSAHRNLQQTLASANIQVECKDLHFPCVCFSFWRANKQQSPRLLSLTFNAEFKADMAERQGARFCLELADTTDIVIVQINVDELLLFIHGASGGKKTVKESTWLNTRRLHNQPPSTILLIRSHFQINLLKMQFWQFQQRNIFSLVHTISGTEYSTRGNVNMFLISGVINKLLAYTTD